jgi:hypothetical protein
VLHRQCRRTLEALERQVASLLARIGDLESRNERLLDQLLEERKASAERETELSDRILAIANPLAARMAGVGQRSAAPAAPPPTIERSGREGGGGRSGVRPLLQPRRPSYLSVTDLMDRQRRRSAERAEGAPAAQPAEPEAENAPGAEAPPAEEPEIEPERITFPPSGA